MRAMNSRWFSFQGSTLKRVSMERKREKDLLEELRRLQGPAREQKARRDNLLRLIRKLQKQQALGPPAVVARSPSLEVAVVAQAVEEFLMSSGLPLSPKEEYQSGSKPSRTWSVKGIHLCQPDKGPAFFCECTDTNPHPDSGMRIVYFD